MSETAKQLWLDFLQAYKEARLLWDGKDEHRFNKELRNQAFENLFEEYYKAIDENATIEDMKNKITNMRTAYKREIKKIQEGKQKGRKIIPTLWYYDFFASFMEDSQHDRRQYHTINFFRNSMQSQRPFRSDSYRALRSTRSFNGSFKEEEKDQDDDEPEVTETTESPAQKKRRIFNLLQKQEKFVDRASQMLDKREEDWEVHGKAIALQLYQLNKTQRTIAQKLISDTIFYGGLERLTEDTFINVNNIRQASPEIHEQIDYLEEEFESEGDQ